MPDINFKSLTTVLGEESDHFAEDIEVKEINKLETLLNDCDEIDQKIIKMLLDDQTNAKIAESLFISRSTLIYRINKLLNCCECETKEKTVDLLNKYTISF